jgi:heme oxygenase (biliverdin-IX-beta and delta-forming)
MRMPEAIDRAVRELIEAQRIASLGTLHDGEPYVSMVPFAVLADGPEFVVHVSALAAHTKDMLAESRVSLLVIAPDDPAIAPQATARLTIQGDAARLDESEARYAAAKRAYMDRFPQSAQTFALPDFSIFLIRPRALRFVGGFAQAKSLTPEGLARILA